MRFSLLFWAVLFSYAFACRSSSGNQNATVVVLDRDTVKIWHSYDMGREDAPVNETIPLKSLVDSLGVDTSGLSILVDKGDYLLSVLDDTVVIKQYRVVFGRNPVDEKTYEGDCCTPEGSFKVLMKYEHERWSRFIWFDYPNEGSLFRHREAQRAGIVPAGRGPGGQVGIHGVPPGNDYLINYRINWTAGCISLKNEDVEDLYPFVCKGMVVEIVK